MKQNDGKTWLRHADLGAVAVIAVIASSISGRYATEPNLSWYGALTKPWFNPPDWIFGPVWIMLYLLMAFAVWRLSRAPASPVKRIALVLFFVQLALNAAWSWMFFAAHSPLLGLINVIPQFLAVLATVSVAFRVDRRAAFALVPLAAWVGFASVLNAAVWSLNP